MVKTLEIEIQELREQIAQEIEGLKNAYDPYSNSGMAAINACNKSINIARGTTEE
jgi:hypothetical protein